MYHASVDLNCCWLLRLLIGLICYPSGTQNDPANGLPQVLANLFHFGCFLASLLVSIFLLFCSFGVPNRGPDYCYKMFLNLIHFGSHFRPWGGAWDCLSIGLILGPILLLFLTPFGHCLSHVASILDPFWLFFTTRCCRFGTCFVSFSILKWSCFGFG